MRELEGPDERVHFPLPVEFVDEFDKRGIDPERAIEGFRQRWYVSGGER